MVTIETVKHPETTAEKTMWTNAWIYANEPILKLITGRHPAQTVSRVEAVAAVNGISQSVFDEVRATASTLFNYDFDEELQTMVRDRIVNEIGHITLWPREYLENPDNAVRLVSHAMFFYRGLE